MNAGGLWRATGTLAGANGLALALAFLTTMLVARAFGTSAAMDAYTIAIALPESLQYLLMLATLSVVFTPLFIETRARHGESEAWSMALSLLVLVVAFVVVLIPLLALLMPWLMLALAPGFAPETRALAVELGDLILPGLIYYATAGLLLGICYAYHDFTTAALNTLLLASLNLAAFLLFVSALNWGVRGLMLGRLIALGAMQLFLLWRTLRLIRSFGSARATVHIRLRDPHVWQMLTYMPPYMFGAISGQAALLVNRSLVSTLGAGSVAAWGYGQRLAEIPMAVLGAPLGATYLPDFAANVAQGENASASEKWNRAIARAALVLTPVAALLVALGAPLIALLFQRGAFDAAATAASAQVLAGLALALPLRGIGGLIVRGMPAFKSRQLPLLLSALSTGASILFAFLLLGPLGLFGVALAVSLGDLLFAVVGTAEFWRRLHFRSAASELVELGKIVLGASAGAGAAAWVAQWAWSEWIGVETLARLVQVSAAGAVGMAVFGLVSFVLRVNELDDLLRRRNKQIALNREL